MNFDKTTLIISQTKVNESTIVKKLKPRARGHSYPIKRPTCHITTVLQDISKDKKNLSMAKLVDTTNLIGLSLGMEAYYK